MRDEYTDSLMKQWNKADNEMSILRDMIIKLYGIDEPSEGETRRDEKVQESHYICSIPKEKDITLEG